MDELTLAAVGLSLLAGVVTFVSPCFLPLVPAYLGYLAGGTGLAPAAAGTPARQAMVVRACWFVLGFTMVFVAMGAAASPIGSVLREHLDRVNLIGGILLVVFGAFMAFEHRLPVRLLGSVGFSRVLDTGPVGPSAALGFGMVFAFAWTPCIGPTLGAALTLAGAHDTMLAGMVLLAVFSAGLGIPFLLLSVAADSARGTARWLAQRAGSLRMIGGIVLIVFGVLVALGLISDVTAELQRVTPEFLTP